MLLIICIFLLFVLGGKTRRTTRGGGLGNSRFRVVYFLLLGFLLDDGLLHLLRGDLRGMHSSFSSVYERCNNTMGSMGLACMFYSTSGFFLGAACVFLRVLCDVNNPHEFLELLLLFSVDLGLCSMCNPLGRATASVPRVDPGTMSDLLCVRPASTASLPLRRPMRVALGVGHASEIRANQRELVLGELGTRQRRVWSVWLHNPTTRSLHQLAVVFVKCSRMGASGNHIGKYVKVKRIYMNYLNRERDFFFMKAVFFHVLQILIFLGVRAEPPWFVHFF